MEESTLYRLFKPSEHKSGKSLDQMKFETAFKIAYLRALIRAEKDEEIDENRQCE